MCCFQKFCFLILREPSNALWLKALLWRHNGRDGVSNHQSHDCLINRSFRRRSKKTSKPCVTGLDVGFHRGQVNSPHKRPVTRKIFPFDDVIMKLRGDHIHRVVWDLISRPYPNFKNILTTYLRIIHSWVRARTLFSQQWCSRFEKQYLTPDVLFKTVPRKSIVN